MLVKSAVKILMKITIEQLVSQKIILNHQGCWGHILPQYFAKVTLDPS